ncbi:MAG: hypothetical protein COY58_09060 [Gammaproteobacteria bacterium CG_4_10_14_0_8_um_filter_38_16]|nr:MAG: hypothetical protein COY58_09060 [Gammaproteobacteria bacterium CG_4_10_14_0_8_um_filter_38_16]PJA03390.1 MAG: hypothetical protein COX72_05495 [Gammaproteobacteria bacterium CG_4_10_14_0_2_um_filter_38_22]PJB11122.1 MAG: hypothetical protein CO120_01235 [Gammaproteobacteria bacterium CG_4_9_14_3_um_filter_38_9]
MNNFICNKCNLNIYVDLNVENSSYLLFENIKCHSFCVLKNHGVSTNFIGKVYKEWIPFFEGESKFNYIRSDFTDEGYVAFNTEIAEGSDFPDNKEFYESHYKGSYPDNINTFQTLKLLDSFVGLTKKILFLIDEEICDRVLNFRDSLSSIIAGDNNHMMRIIHYPAKNQHSGLERAAPHGDACLFTILPVATSRGVKFLTPSNEWLDFKVAKSEIIFFNGDMIELYTDGYLKSAIHKVTYADIDIIQARYSIPFFIHPKRNIVLKNRMTAYEFLKRRLTSIGYDGNKLLNKDD